MNDQEFKSLHNKITINVRDDRELEESISSQFVEIYHNEADRQNYLNWLTINTKIIHMPQEVKSVQNCINKTTMQRAIFRMSKQEKLTQRVRLMRANKPLLYRGLCTQEQVDNKEYLFHIENLSSNGDSSDDFNSDLHNVLSSKEKLVVYLYFGFHTDDSKSLGQIANFMDVSRSSVEKMLKEALAKMESHLKDLS